VELEQSARWGLLGKGAVLMAAAYPEPHVAGAARRVHPQAHQGVPPATPPPNVPTLDEKDIGTTEGSHLAPDDGEAPEQPHLCVVPRGDGSARAGAREFDATGMWRDRDRYAGAAIDSSGELPDGTPIKGPDDLRQALLRKPSSSCRPLPKAC
jgi:hypothetical protein